ncbi:MAG TPA: hypothetical protein VGF30_05710 [Bacteroidia bacterium]
MKYITYGLGNGTFLENKYEFDVIDKFLYIPGNYVGRDQMGDPHHPEQKDWINSLSPSVAVKEVWYGTWEFSSDKDVADFIKLLDGIPGRGI